MTFEWYKDVMVFHEFIFIFLFRANGNNGHLDENDSHTVMVVFPKVPFCKLLDRRYVQSSFSTIMRHIENIILKDTLQLKTLWTRIKIRSSSFITASVNMIKGKPVKVPGKLSVAQKFESALQNIAKN